MRKLLYPVMSFPYYRDKIRATRHPPVEHPRCVSHPSTITRWPRSARFQHQLMENFQSGVENGKSCSLLFFLLPAGILSTPSQNVELRIDLLIGFKCSEGKKLFLKVIQVWLVLAWRSAHWRQVLSSVGSKPVISKEPTVLQNYTSFKNHLLSMMYSFGGLKFRKSRFPKKLFQRQLNL